MQMHIFCWGVALAFTLLPLSTSTYGVTPQWNGKICCNLNSTHAYAWLSFILTTFLVLCIAVNAMLLGQILSQKSAKKQLFAPMVIAAIELLQWYPATLIMFVPALIGCYASPQASPSLFAFCTLHGAVVPLIFFTKSKEAQQRWMQALGLIRRPIASDFANPDEYVGSLRVSMSSNPADLMETSTYGSLFSLFAGVHRKSSDLLRISSSSNTSIDGLGTGLADKQLRFHSKSSKHSSMDSLRSPSTEGQQGPVALTGGMAAADMFGNNEL